MGIIKRCKDCGKSFRFLTPQAVLWAHRGLEMTLGGNVLKVETGATEARREQRERASELEGRRKNSARE